MYQAINEQAILSLPLSKIGVNMILSKRDLEHDSLADVQALEEAHFESVYHFIRTGLSVHDYIQEIECDASFCPRIEKLYRNLFTGGQGDLLAREMQQFAENWLDDYATKKARQVVDGGL